MEGKSDHQRTDPVRFDRVANRFGVGREFRPAHRVVRGGDRAGHVGQGHANGLGAHVEPEQPYLRRQQLGQVFDGDERCYSHERSIRG